MRASGEADSYVVGCPGGGTVFSIAGKEIEFGAFSCQNGGRQRSSKGSGMRRADVQQETCRNCRNTYKQYLQRFQWLLCHIFYEQ